MNMISNASFWILTKYYELENKLAESSANYELAHSVDAIYKFLWDYYADWYIEYLKTDATQIPFAKSLFKQFVITSSPYCPFETEALWHNFFGEKTLLANEVKDFEWSKKAFSIYYNVNDLTDLQKNPIYREFQTVVEFVQNLRSTRGLFAIDPANFIQIYTIDTILLGYSDFIKMIARTELMSQERNDLYSVKNNLINYSIDILSYIKDKQTEISRTNKIIIDLQKQIAGQESKLNNPKFIENAEPEVILETKDAITKRTLELKEQKAKLEFLEK
jgi:valyl-tRNA synthetase